MQFIEGKNRNQSILFPESLDQSLLVSQIVFILYGDCRGINMDSACLGQGWGESKRVGALCHVKEAN